MRPLVRWILFSLCLVIFTVAMGWITVRTLELENQRQRTAEEAQVQEKIRLALWRMDSLASALLIRENARPPHHYQAFYAPEDLFLNSTQALPSGQALIPSPLFGSLPELVQLHFEKIADSPTLESPQAPVGKQEQIATSWYTLTPEVKVTSEKLRALESLIQRHPELQEIVADSATHLIELKTPTPTAAIPEAKAPASKESPLDTQNIANATEQFQRARILDNTSPTEKKDSFKPQLKQAAPAPTGRAQPTLNDVVNRYQSSETQASAESSVPVAPTRQALPTIAGDMQPLWLGNELLLLRQATLEGKSRLQGAWLDWPSLERRLLEAIRDLLPEAKLLAVSTDLARTDATALVTLPVKLVAGAVAVIPDTLGSALKPALALAWLCLIAAAVAIAFVLHRAVLLSERRGAFVSAVTHELRTPLTTFRLYSEMLADDMVPDPTQRRSYLQTLCDESTRLMHLVENVLAYSRIERGRTAGRMELVSVQSLLDRFLPRLRERAAQVDLTLELTATPEALATQVQVDALAVEQVLFNLTDNASKYAAPDCDPRNLELHIQRTGKSVAFTLRDFGPGLPRAQKKRLFQPFSKSATEAAHSAPGVGLGLALSRRLARELGGDLVHHIPEGRGAAFCLTVKAGV